MKIYVVAIFWTDIDCLSDAFISVFSTREAAESFAAKRANVSSPITPKATSVPASVSASIA